MAEQIVQVTGKPQPLLPYRQPRDLFACLAQLLVRLDQQSAGHGGEPNQQFVEQLTGGRGHGFPAGELDHRCQDRQDDDRRHAAPPGEGRAPHDDRVEEQTAVLGRGAKREYGQEDRRSRDGRQHKAAIGAGDDPDPEPSPDQGEGGQEQQAIDARLGAESIGQECTDRIDEKRKPGHHEEAAQLDPSRVQRHRVPA